MDNEQARFILQAYRPNGQDASDPQFREALEQVKHDPSLERWFTEEQALDNAISRKLKSAPVPPDLKATILAGQKVIRPKRWWEQPPVVALAAALAFLLVAVDYWLQTKPSTGELTLAAFQADMAATFGTPHRFESMQMSASQVKAWLAEHGGQADFASPTGLRSAPQMACDVLDWHGKKVTLVCYVGAHDGTRKEMHLLVINRSDLPGAPLGETPQFVQVGNHATATWTQGERTYLLASGGDKEYLQRYF